MDFSLFKEVFESSKMDFILSHAMYCRDVLKLKKGQRAVISNGRVRTLSQDKLGFQLDLRTQIREIWTQEALSLWGRACSSAACAH